MIANMSVKTRLFLTFAILGAALLAVGLLGLRALKQSNGNLDAVYNQNLMAITYITSTISASQNDVLGLDEALLIGDADTLAGYKQDSADSEALTNALWEKFMALPMTSEEKVRAQEFASKRAKYRESRDAITAELGAGKVDEARRMRIGSLEGAVDDLRSAAQSLLDREYDSAEAANMQAGESYARSLIVSWSAIGAGIVAAAVCGWLLVTSMMRSLNTAVSISERIATGELGQDIQISSQDEFGRLLTALRNMDMKLSEIVGTVRVSSDEVASAAREISHGNDDLSQRTQEQASALEETASSMEEMTATVKQNADNARQASQLAVSARDQADRGGNVVGRAVTAMSEISDSSRRIADIIDVIDEIAFQTNLLALNAAVEAARAGEQGRGFAVVASEVRNLAQRSATAAKEIKDLIGDSVQKVKVGTELVDESGQALTEIVASVKKVADIVAEISAASEEQATGIDQVNNAVTEMDSVTQQNAALVEEASAASKSMEHQAQNLIQKISFFRVGQRQVEASPTEAMQQATPSAPVRSLASANRPAAAKARVAQRAPVASHSGFAKAAGDDSSWQEF